MERKITLQEIEQLHRFVRRHYVEFYDVELELVDHLANDIEAQWQEDTQLSFDLALDQAFKKFGIFGFTDVIEQKTNELNKVYYKESFRLLRTFFTIPKIVISIALSLIIYVILRFVGKELSINVKEIARGAVFLFFMYQFIRLQLRRAKQNKKSQLKWLLQTVVFNLEIWPYYLMFMFFFQIFMFEGTSNFSLISQTMVITLTILYVYVLKAVIIPQVKEDLRIQKQRVLLA